jgi:hypothetical protein
MESAECALAVAGVDAGGQAVTWFVSDGDRFVLGVEGDDGDHRAEDLLGGDPRVAG